MSIPELPTSSPPRGLRLHQLLDVANTPKTSGYPLVWDAATGKWKATLLGTAGLADGSVTFAKLNADVGTSFDSRWVNVAGDTMTGALALPSNGLNVGSGQLQVTGGNTSISGDLLLASGKSIAFPVEFKDNKIDLWGAAGGFSLGIASGEIKHSVPILNFHRFRVNAVTKLEVGGSAVDIPTRLTQSGDYAYVGAFNAGIGPTYPRAGNDLGIGWNFTGGSREVTFWNTDTTPATVPFDFRQLTGASSSAHLMRLGYTSSIPQVLLPSGSSGLPGAAYIDDTDTGWHRSAANTMQGITGAVLSMTLVNISGVGHVVVPSAARLSLSGYAASGVGTPATVNNKYAVYDSSGTLVGYIPIFTTL